MSQYTVVIPAQTEEISNQQSCKYSRCWHYGLMFAQLVFGATSLGLVADLGSYHAQAVLSGNEFTVNAFISFGESTALMMVCYGCIMTTSLLLFSSLISPKTYSHVPKSLFFVLYHMLSAILYLSCGLSVVILGYQRRYDQLYINAGALGIINSTFYVCSMCLGLRALQGSK